MKTILMFRWPWGLASLVIVFAMTLAFDSMTPLQYRARGQMLLVQNVTGASGMDQVFAWRLYFSNVALARLGTLPATGQKAHTHLNAWLEGAENRPEHLPEVDEAAAEKLQALTPSHILSLVSVTPDTENVAVEINGWHEDEAFIHYVVQAVLEGLIDTLVDHELAMVNTEGVEQIILSTQNGINDVEREISSIYSEGMEKGLMPKDISRTLDRIEELNRTIEETRLAIIEVEQRVNTYQAILTSPDRLTGKMPVPLTLVDELLRKELLLDDYRRKYTEENPKLKKLVREIEGLRQTIEQVKQDPDRFGLVGRQFDRGWQTENVELAVATESARKAAYLARLETLESQRKALEEKIAASDTDDNTIRLRILEKRREALRTLLEDLNRRVEQGRWVREGLLKKDPAFTKVEKVNAATGRAAPNSSLVYVLALLVGLFAGAAVMYFMENMDTTIHSVENAETIAAARVLGEIPFFSADPFIFPENPTTRTANVFSLLRNHLRYSDTNHPEKAFAVTSPRPGDGKSFVAVNLAISFAQEGNRTVLVDCDLRHPDKNVYQEALLVQAHQQHGLIHMLENPDILPENILSATEITELVVVGAGGVAHNPPRLLRSEAFANLLKMLQEQFDVVILDTPPVIAVVDAGVIAEQVRGVLVVARWGITRNHELKGAVERVRHVRGRVLGIALNQSPSAEPDYYYYMHSEADVPVAVQA